MELALLGVNQTQNKPNRHQDAVELLHYMYGVTLHIFKVKWRNEPHNPSLIGP